jgi:hypothetical protein
LKNPVNPVDPVGVLIGFFGGIAKWLRQRSAKPLFIGSNPIAASSRSQRSALKAGLFLRKGWESLRMLEKSMVGTASRPLISHLEPPAELEIDRFIHPTASIAKSVLKKPLAGFHGIIRGLGFIKTLG